MENKKIATEFNFNEHYHTAGGSRMTVTVKLNIDYELKTFNIEPFTGAKGFVFKDNSHEWKMWKAVAACISEAIDFATKELGFVAKDPIAV